MSRRYLLASLLIMILCLTSLEAKTRKAIYIIIDGVPADMIERIHPPVIYDIASRGAYARAYTGGEIGGYSETATISAIGYTNLLTATWYNKHNVGGNDNLSPNYNYWTIFRIAKEQQSPFTTGLYSSWTDNRTVLIGEGKPETGGLKIDYVRDGYDLDHETYPRRERELNIYDIDETVSKEAAQSIRTDAPDLSWVYLWYTDDAGHYEGNGAYFDEYVLKADAQVGRIWDAIKYREEHYNEQWMVVVTTDHGRNENGHDHGGQSLRERTTWVSTNVPVNAHFSSGELAIVDIAPSISRYLGFEVSRDVLWEQDGISFIGDADVHALKTSQYDDTVILSWDLYSDASPLTVFAAAGDEFKQGRKDRWIKVADLPAGTTTYTVALSDLPYSDSYKFVVTSASNHINRSVSIRR